MNLCSRIDRFILEINPPPTRGTGSALRPKIGNADKKYFKIHTLLNQQFNIEESQKVYLKKLNVTQFNVIF